MKLRTAAARTACLFLGCVCGCMAEPSPYSPTPAEDPARFVRATEEMDQVARQNAAAEARFWGRSRKGKFKPGVEHANIAAEKL